MGSEHDTTMIKVMKLLPESDLTYALLNDAEVWCHVVTYGSPQQLDRLLQQSLATGRAFDHWGVLVCAAMLSRDPEAMVNVLAKHGANFSAEGADPVLDHLHFNARFQGYAGARECVLRNRSALKLARGAPGITAAHLAATNGHAK